MSLKDIVDEVTRELEKESIQCDALCYYAPYEDDDYEMSYAFTTGMDTIDSLNLDCMSDMMNSLRMI